MLFRSAGGEAVRADIVLVDKVSGHARVNQDVDLLDFRSVCSFNTDLEF